MLKKGEFVIKSESMQGSQKGTTEHKNQKNLS
jgi:hypothetical protein